MTSTTQVAARPHVARRSAPPRATLLASMFGFFMITIDVSAVNVGLATVSRDLHAATSGIQWVVDGYTLMFAALLLSAGALSDRIGASRAYAAGIAAFTLASVACGTAPGLGVLIVARAAQGAAAAVMMPSSLALIRQAFDSPAARSRGIALWTAAGAAAVAIGPVAGGLLITVWSWRGIFLINVPPGLAALALLARAPRSPRRPAGLDVAGQVTAVLALGGLTYAMIEGGSAGYTAPTVLAALALAATAAVAFAVAQARAASPVVPLRLFRDRTVVTVIAAGFAANAVFYGVIFLVGLFAQQVAGRSALSTGLLFVPMAVAVTVMNARSPRAAARFGPRRPIVTGLLLAAAGAASLLAVGPDTPGVVMALLLIPLGAGGGLAVPTLTTVLLENVAAESAGVAAGLFNAGRQVGSAIAVALFGSLVAAPGSFRAGMTASLMISVGLVLAAAAGAVRMRRA